MGKLFSLEGRVALVTGGSRGIGRMIAQGFLDHGARVYISSRKADQCEATAAELARDGGQCIAIPGDVSTIEGARALAAALAEKEQRLDILVNNAGAIWLAPFDDYPEKGWDKIVDVNLKAPFFLAQALAPMLRAGATADAPSKIINIASIDGITVNPLDTYAYQASKGGLVHLTKVMAARLIADNIVVSAIAPGAFPSDINVFARDNPDAVGSGIPAKRVGRPDDMAGAAIFLASRAGDYFVGESLIIDGGLTAIGRK